MDTITRHQWFIDRLREIATMTPASADAPDISSVIDHHQLQITLHRLAARIAAQ